MPRASIVAKNYAKALFLAAIKNNVVEKIATELKAFKEKFSADFANELQNPVISKNNLVEIIAEITKKLEFSDLTSAFFASLAKNRRLKFFSEINEEFTRLLKKQKNILEVELISASKTDQSQFDQIKLLVEKKYPNQIIELKEVVKKQILGGFQIKVGSNIIDLSLENQLISLNRELLSVAN